MPASKLRIYRAGFANDFTDKLPSCRAERRAHVGIAILLDPDFVPYRPPTTDSDIRALTTPKAVRAACRTMILATRTKKLENPGKNEEISLPASCGEGTALLRSWLM